MYLDESNNEFSCVGNLDGGGFVLVGFSQTGEVDFSYSLGTDITDGFWRPITYQRSGNYHAIIANGVPFSANVRNALFVFNSETGVSWSKQISKLSVRTDFVKFTPNGLICSHYFKPGGSFSPNSLGITLLNIDSGQKEWLYFYDLLNVGAGGIYQLDGVDVFPDGSPSVFLEYLSSTNVLSHGLLKLASNGDLLKSVSVSNDSIKIEKQVVDSEGNVYLAGRKALNGDFDDYIEGFIVKLDSNYNLIWCKRLVADHFRSYSIDIKNISDGDLIFTYVTYGELPVIYGRISKKGEILWKKGLSFFRPEIVLDGTGAIYFSSLVSYDENFEIYPEIVMAKTDSLGNIDNCPQYDACLELEDMEIVFEEWEWERSEAPELPYLDVVVEPVGYTSVPHCGTPPAPEPVFEFLDTLCQGTCASPTGLKNKLAHYAEWTISGPDVDTIIADTTFTWCFDNPGTYVIEQETWLLGCSDIFSKEVVILPDDLGEVLGEDRVVCEDVPYLLVPESDRTLTVFEWGDGSANPVLPVFYTGNYALETSDGYCFVKDTVALTFLEDILTNPPLVLPADTTLCPEFLPYALMPESDYSSVFFLNDALQPQPDFLLSSAGQYHVGVEVEGCRVISSFNLEVESCVVPVFIPNSFSPNKDGVNDVIAPQGPDFGGITMQVYDRWGGLVFQTDRAPFEWDGYHGNDIAATGVYVLVFRFLNKKSFREEIISQDVLLVR